MQDDDVMTEWGLMPPPTAPAQVRAQSLRRPKNVQPQITNNVAAQEPVSTQPDPYGPPSSAQSPQPRGRSGLVQQAQGALPGLYAEQEKAMGPQDYSGMQNYAKQRGAEGQHALLLSLAAQAAGKEFEPVGGAMLKRAMAARDPLKTSTGFITDQGEHIEDAQLRADQRLKQVSAQIARNEQIIQSAATAEEKELARQETLALKREQMEATMEMRRLTAAVAQGARADRRGDRDLAQGQKVGAAAYDDYMRNTKDQQTQVNAYQNLQATAKRTDAASDLSFIFQYMKMLDPGSVVRESEYATAQNARGVPDAIRNMHNQVLEGRRLTPTQREQFLGTAGNLAAQAEQQMGTRRADLARQLEANRVDPSVYLPGYAPPDAGPPQGAVRVRGAQPAAPAAAPDAPPPGAVRPKGAR
jgi:hypothetical protein